MSKKVQMALCGWQSVESTDQIGAASVLFDGCPTPPLKAAPDTIICPLMPVLGLFMEDGMV
jgi:hypothetical protein